MSANQKILFALILACTFAVNASACPACYGQATGSVAEGTNAAILAMLGITGFVLGSISTFFIFMFRRVRLNCEKVSTTSFVDDNGNIHLKEDKGIIEWNNS